MYQQLNLLEAQSLVRDRERDLHLSLRQLDRERRTGHAQGGMRAAGQHRWPALRPVRRRRATGMVTARG